MDLAKGGASVLPVIRARRAGVLPHGAVAVRGSRRAAAAVDRAAVAEEAPGVVEEVPEVVAKVGE